MNKKYTILLGTIAVLVIALVLTILIKDKGILKPRIKKLKDTIVSIEVQNGENKNIKIVNENGKWKVNNNYNIDIGIVESMIDSIEKVNINTLVSKPTDEMLEKYNLKGNAIIVSSLNSNAQVIRKIVIGERATLSYDIYGQIDKDKNIYLLTSNLNLYDIFSQSLDKIVSKSISSYSLYDTDIVTVMDSNTNKYTLTKQIITNNPPITNINGIVIDKEEYWVNQDDVKVEGYDATSMYDILDITAEIVDDSIVRNKTKLLYRVSVDLPSETPNTIKKEYSIYDKGENGMYRVVVRSENLNYYINEDRYNRIKNAVEFMKSPKAKK